MTRRAAAFAATLCLLAPAGAARGFIQKMYSLQEVLNESTHVLVCRLERVDASARTAVAAVERTLKGKPEFQKVLMNIALGPAHHARYVIERMRSGAPAIIFYKREGDSIASLVHAGDVWFQLFASDNPKDRQKVWWRMSHVEIYMGRTYNGPTPALVDLVEGVLAGRTRPPKPDSTVPTLDLEHLTRQLLPSVPKGKGGGFSRQMEFRHDGGEEIRGLCWADVDGDERLDVMLCRQRGSVLLLNRPGGFQPAGPATGLAGGSRSATWADYDGDDHPDLLTNDFHLFTNVGGKLRDDSALLARPPRCNTEGAGWIDYNADGRPDVLVTNGEHGIRLFENTGRKPAWFRDVSDRAGLGEKGLGKGNGDFLVCLDYDSDGYADFFYNLDQGVLARNQGDGTFRLEGDCGIRLDEPGYKRGVAVGDFDNDGHPDLFVPGPKRAQLHRNREGAGFVDVFARAGDLTAEEDPSFAAAWGDVNCDGALDLFVCHTHGSSRLYLGDGKGRFSDISEAAGVKGLSPAYGASFADVDGDGDLDLVVNLPERIVVALNDLPRPEGCAPLTVRAHARRGLVGATVRVLEPGGRLRAVRQLALPEGPGGQSCPIAHFGLPRGSYLVAVCLSDGRVAQKTLTVDAKPVQLAFDEEQFK